MKKLRPSSNATTQTPHPLEIKYWKAGIRGVYSAIVFGFFTLLFGFFQILKSSQTNQVPATEYKKVSTTESEYRPVKHLAPPNSNVNSVTMKKIASLIALAKMQEGQQNILAYEVQAYQLLPKRLQTIHLSYLDDNGDNIQLLDNKFASLNLLPNP